MWRFVLVTFGFLGWAFYEMSGGADYAPREGSVQAVRAEIRARTEQQVRRVEIARDVVRAIHTPAMTTSASPTRARHDAQVVLATTAGADEPLGTKRQHLTLSNQPDSTGRGVARPALNPEKRDALTITGTQPPSNLSAEEQAARAIDIVTRHADPDAAGSDSEPIEPAAARPGTFPHDIRVVSGARVNLRGGPGTQFAIVDSLPRGTRVEVLNDPGQGWVELQVSDGTMTGWMADRLLAASN